MEGKLVDFVGIFEDLGQRIDTNIAPDPLSAKFGTKAVPIPVTGGGAVPPDVDSDLDSVTTHLSSGRPASSSHSSSMPTSVDSHAALEQQFGRPLPLTPKQLRSLLSNLRKADDDKLAVEALHRLVHDWLISMQVDFARTLMTIAGKTYVYDYESAKRILELPPMP